MSIAPYSLITLAFLLLGLNIPVKADTVFLPQENGLQLPCEAIIVKVNARETRYLRLLKGMFISDEPLVLKGEKAISREREAIIERWKLAGWTANVRLTAKPATQLFNCEIYYPPANGLVIADPRLRSVDYFLLEQNGKSITVHFADVDRITAAADRHFSVALVSGTILTGTIASLPSQNGGFPPAFRGVQRFPQVGLPIWFSANLSEIQEIRFEKHPKPQPLTPSQLASLMPARLAGLRVGVNVILTKDWPLTERGTVFRTARAGELFNVSTYNSTNSDVEIFARDQRAELTTVKVPFDAITLANP